MGWFVPVDVGRDLSSRHKFIWDIPAFHARAGQEEDVSGPEGLRRIHAATKVRGGAKGTLLRFGFKITTTQVSINSKFGVCDDF